MYSLKKSPLIPLHNQEYHQKDVLKICGKDLKKGYKDKDARWSLKSITHM